MAFASAFHNAFADEVWMSCVQGQPHDYSTFAPLARLANCMALIMPPNLLLHMQRTLWHIPLAARILTVPMGQHSRLDDIGGSIGLHVADALPHLFLTVNFAIMLAVVLVGAAMGMAFVVYIALVPTGVDHLMVSLLVHTMTVASRNGPAVPGACLASIEDIFAAASDERIQYGALVPAMFNSIGNLGVGVVSGHHPCVGKLEQGMWYGGDSLAELRNRKSYDRPCDY
jgi:hypothetical protein